MLPGFKHFLYKKKKRERKECRERDARLRMIKKERRYITLSPEFKHFLYREKEKGTKREREIYEGE